MCCSNTVQSIEENLGFGPKADEGVKQSNKPPGAKGAKKQTKKSAKKRTSRDSDDDDEEEDDDNDDEDVKPAVDQSEADDDEDDGEEEEDEEEEEEDEMELDTPEIAAKKRELEFCLSAMAFINGMKAAMPTVEIMLGSRAASDVIEVLHFFVRAMRFNVPGSAKAIQKSLALIWHPDQAIRDECIDAFLQIFVRPADKESQLSPRQIADNLVQLAVRCSVSEATSMERIVAELVVQKNIPQEVFVALWAIVSDFKSQGTDVAERYESCVERDSQID